MSNGPDRDELSGIETTGHEWDGIKELNNPLPRWWLWTFYATIVWAVVYWVVMPAWPVITGDGWTYTKGVLGYSARDVATTQVVEAREVRAEYNSQIADTSFDEIAGDPNLMQVALAGGEAAFGDNCAPCHGSGAQGFKGFPNLNDDAWLWGGTRDDIQQTITHGIRWEADPDTRYSMMPAFGTDGLLDRSAILDVVAYVRSIGGLEHKAEEASRGATVYEENCVACHGAEGKGEPMLGAPNLTDAIWLYGSDEEDLYVSIAQARNGVMPAWGERLSEATIKELTLYVHSLGGGQTAPDQMSSAAETAPAGR